MFAPFPLVASRIAKVLGVVFFVTAVVGAIQNFSPVPFWDMWDGYLNFYVRVTNGDYAAWWAQHVDHRTVVSNLLFWIDLRVFNGALWFLILVNYLLVLATWLTLRSIAQSVLPEKKLATSRSLYSGVTLALLFSWTQKENLTWAFQSQMFTGILFPMIAFMLFYRAENSTGRRSKLYYVGSLATGVVSAGTMINGLAALPIMAVLGILLRASKTRISLIVVLAVAISVLYFLGFAAPNSPERSSLFRSLLEQPLNVLTFFFAYIGAPAHFIIRDGLLAAVITGSLIVCGFAWVAVTSLGRPIENRARYIILAVLLYAILSSIGIAGSRINLGVEYAFTSRYMTNVLVLWAAMILLLLYRCPTMSRCRTVVFFFMLAIPTALLPTQVQALKKDSNALTDRLVAALALELGVQDEEQITKIFPWMRPAIVLAQKPIERNLSIFGDPLIRDAAKSLMSVDQHHGIDCVGSIETINVIPGDRRFARLSLWLMDRYTHLTPNAFYVLNPKRKIIGYGVSGYVRYGLTDTGEAHNAGGSAYVLTDAMDDKLILKGRDYNCEVLVQLPDARHLTSMSFTDPQNWTNGVAKDWGPAVLLKLAQSKQQGLHENRKLRFADGTVRTISKVEERGDLAIVYVDGDYLDGILVGFPRKIEVLDK